MIVVATPRSGATKICMDLAEKNNLKFLDELIPRNMTDLRLPKEASHETGYGVRFTREEWISGLKNEPGYLSLCNNPGSDLMLPKADYVVMRKNLKNTIYSWINYQTKTNRSLRGTRGRAVSYFFTVQVIELAYGIIQYCLADDNVNIIWYEDYFPDVDTAYSYISGDRKIDTEKLCENYSFVFDSLDELIKKQGV